MNLLTETKYILRLLFYLFCLVGFTLSSVDIFGQGYTTPADSDGNGTPDYLESGSAPTVTIDVSPTTVCAGDDAMFATVVTGSDLIFQWFESTDGGTVFNEITASGSSPAYSGFNDDTLHIAGVPVSYDGNLYRLRIISTTYSCDTVYSSTEELSVTASPSPPGGSSPQSFCAIDSETVGDLTVTGTGIIWYTASTGGTVVAASTTLVDGTTYYASQTVSGCESDTRLAVTANVADPTAPTGNASQDFCAIDSETVGDLAVTGAGIIWYDASTGGSVVAASTALVDGTTYYASQTVSGCESDTRLAVTANVADPAAPTGSANQDFCALNAPTVADLSAVGTSIAWYSASSGGSPLDATAALSDGTVYFASQTISGCESDTRFEVLVSWTSVPAPGVSDQTFCLSNSPTVADLVATGTNIQWYSAASGGSALSSSDALVDGMSYFASQTVSGCESGRSEAVVTISSELTVSCTAPSDVPVDADCEYTLVDLSSTLTINACDGYTVTQLPTIGSVLGLGDHTISFEVTDGVSTASCDYTLTVIDNINPVAVCQNITVALDASGNATISASDIDNGSSDNCGIDNLSLDISAFDCSDVGDVSVTLTASDAAGNSHSCGVIVTVEDNLDPVISVCPSITTAQLNSDCQYVMPDLTAILSATDNCTAASSLTVTQTPAPGSVINGEGSHTLEFEVEDENGNVEICSSSFVTFDGQTPNFTCPYPSIAAFDTVQVSLDVNCEFVIPDYWDGVTATDNCTDPLDMIYTQTIAPGTALTGAGTFHMIQVRAQDESSNVQACAWYFELVDDSDPIITTCPSDANVTANADCEYVMTDYVGAVVASDNCTASADLIITQDPIVGTVFTGSQLVIVTVEDEVGNSATCQFTLTIEDNEAPIPNVSALPDITAQCDTILTAPTATDNCSGSITATTSDATSYSTQGVNVVTWTYTDGEGNFVEQTQNVTIEDTTDPVAVCQTTTLNLGGGTVTLLPADVDGGSTDNCGISSMAVSPNSFSAVGTYNVTLTVTDIAGNTGQCSVDIEVEDTSAPVAVCQNIDVYLEATGAVTITGLDLDDGSFDNGNIVDYEALQTDFDCSHLGANNVELVVTDDASPTALTDTCAATVTVHDTISPVVYCQDITIYLDSLGNASLAAADINDGSTDNCGIASMSVDISNFTCDDYGDNTVELTVFDSSGNSSSCSATVTVDDQILPVLTCPSQMTVSNDSGQCGASVNYVPPSVWDNCSNSLEATITDTDQEPGDFFPVGVNWITYYATDPNNGLLSTCTFAITVEDTEGPSLVCPSDDTVSADANCEFEIGDYTSGLVFSDNCDSNADVVVTQSPSAGTTVSGTQEVTITLTDSELNTTTCIFDVIVDDTTDPTIDVSTCPGNQTVALNSDCEYIMEDFTVGVTATDNCNLPADLIITQVPEPGTVMTGHGAVTNVTVSVSDGNSNVSTCDFLLTTLDSTPPSIDPMSCPSDTTVSLSASCDYELADFTGAVTITDNCADVTSLSVTQNPVPGTILYGHGTIQTVTITVDDGFGNETICEFDVTIEDSTPPTITSCPSNDNVSANSSCEYTVGDYTGLITVSDNCGDASTVTITQLPADGSVINGTTTVVLTATDQNGVAETCSFDIIIDDSTDPVIDDTSCPDDLSVSLDDNCEYAILDYTSVLTVTDNCSSDAGITVTQSPLPGTLLTHHNDSELITLTAQDANGNSAECTFTITAADDIDPEIICPANIQVNTPEGMSNVVVTYTEPVGTDNCSGATTAQTDTTMLTSGSPFPVGTTTLEYTVTDAAGNAITCSFNVTVIDNNGPVIDCPDSAFEFDAPPGDCDSGTPVSLPIPNATDNTGIASLINDYTGSGDASAVYPLGQTLVTWTATDLSGNDTTCVYVVVINDITNPEELVCPNDTVIDATADECGIDSSLVQLTPPTATDACSPIVISNDAPAYYPVGETTVTWVIADTSGNSLNCIQLVTIEDSQAPELVTCQDDITVNAEDGLCGAAVTYSMPTSTDNCGPTTCALQQGLASGSLFPVGTTTVEIECTDQYGNETVCSFDVTVVDTQLPVVDWANDVSYEQVSGTCNSVVTFTLPTASDNCPGATITQTTGSLTSGDTFAPGITTICYTAVDQSGNETELCFDVEITDIEEPVLTSCPEDVMQITDAGLCAAAVIMEQPVAIDNCGNVNFSNSFNGTADASDTYPIGETIVIWTISDDAGNSISSCEVIVTVTDEEAPQIVCPADATVIANAESCEATVTVPLASASDNCTVDSIWNSHNNTADASGTYPLGDTEIVWYAVDVEGNVDSCAMTVTVDTPYAPIISCTNDTIVSSSITQCGADLVLESVVATLPCSIVSIENDVNNTDDASGFYEVGTTIVQWTVTDISGFESTCTHSVTVIDNIDPEISCPADQTVNNSPGMCGAVVSYDAPMVSDNCEIASLQLVSGLASGSEFPIGDTFIEYEVVDASDNSNSCSYTISVIDIEAPVILCPEDVVSLDSLVSFDYPIATDNCYAEMILTSPIDSGEVFPHGNSEVCFQASDAFGNTDECCFNVLVNQPPVAINDSLLVFESDAVYTIDLLDNDFDPDGDSIFVVSYDPGVGQVVVDSDGDLIYDIPDNFCGVDSVLYIISDIYGGLDTAWAFIEVECNPVVFVPEGFSPNGDGVNDQLVILGLRLYPKNELSVFNRWGHEVYRQESYNNDWNGRSQSSLTLGTNNPLPRGTYYYVLDLGNGSLPMRGFLYINDF